MTEKGELYLVRMYQITCGICDDGDYYAYSKVTRDIAEKTFRKQGWEFSKKYGWICSECAKYLLDKDER